MELTRQTWHVYRHVLWRVNFLKQMREMHRHFPRSNRQWDCEQADYIKRVTSAQAELDAFPQEWQGIIEPPA
jgi:hypothetical protein